MSVPRPFTLVAELTYRCPLACPYCSNPLSHGRASDELDAATWWRVFAEAAGLGVVQLHLTGGEPLARADLEKLIEAGRAAELYVNLVTGGHPLTRTRFGALVQAGVDHVQLSLQGADETSADALAGGRFFRHKLEVARWVKEAKLPLTLNVVLHAHNLDQVHRIIELAERLEADRLELANVQYVGWALRNRAALMPPREQLERARAASAAARERLLGTMDVVFVMPDYFSGVPKACMDGWARRFIVVAPDGRVLPCQGAHELRGLEFDSVRDGRLGELWERSPALVRFRGEEWMKEPCRSCSRREVDFGGCRCQAFALTGDAAAADPACHLAPGHALIVQARERGTQGAPVPRRNVFLKGGE